MSEEKKSIFDGFETDERTGEVIIPRASVGVVKDHIQDGSATDGTVSQNGEYIPVALDSEELPELDFDFDFGEEEFAKPAEEADDEIILQSIDEALAAQMAVSLGPVENEEKEAKEAKKKKGIVARVPKWCKIAILSLCSLFMIFALFLTCTKPGQKMGKKIIVSMLASYIDRNIGRENPLTSVPNSEDGANITKGVMMLPEEEGGAVVTVPAPKPTTPPEVEPRQEDYVYNILLIGVEALPQFAGERSDTMILVSINSRDKKIYMTSLMRDMYVPIPGYQDNRLNAAYSYGYAYGGPSGGPALLTDTIERLLQVKIDGYVKVGFDSFEWIVDRLGGVEVTLTAEEAAYLQKTNYISNPSYRNVVAGTQLMNGNQVLGYCRVRKVATANGTGSDFGRTERQRTVLTKIFNKYKEKSVLELLSIFNDCLPQVKTNISKDDMEELMLTVLDNRITKLEEFRIPVSGTFSSVKIGGADVISVKWDKNIQELHKKIFGDAN